MAFTYEGSSQSFDSFMDMLNYIFTAIFIAEAALKIFVFGLAYFHTSWNKFDFFVVIASILDIALSSQQEAAEIAPGGRQQSQTALSIAPQLARVLRVLRVSRVLRIANHYKGLQQLFNTIMLSLSGLLNVFMLLMLFFFILAILGQFMFSGVTEGEVISDYKNFTVFDRSFLLLFSISTGEDWNLIMFDCSRTPPACEPGRTCGNGLAPAYFIAFILLVTYVMLNLFILVIIQQFQKLYLDQAGPLQLFNRDYEIIVKQWIKFTRHQRCLKLNASKVPQLLKSIPPPLGYSDLSEAQLKKEVLKMGIKSEDGFIYFNELLYRILRSSYGKFNLNRAMQVCELITQYKLFRITMSAVKVSKVNTLEKFLRKVGSGGDLVNPFLTQMYFRISFLAWYKTMRRYERDQDIRRIRALNARSPGSSARGRPGSASELDQQDVRPSIVDERHEVVVEIEKFSDQTVSSDEEQQLEGNDNEVRPDRADPLELVLRRQSLRAKPTARGIREASKTRMVQAKANALRSMKTLTLDERKIQAKTNEYLRPAFNTMIDRLIQRQDQGGTAGRVGRSGARKGVRRHSALPTLAPPLTKTESSPTKLDLVARDSSLFGSRLKKSNEFARARTIAQQSVEMQRGGIHVLPLRESWEVPSEKTSSLDDEVKNDFK